MLERGEGPRAGEMLRLERLAKAWPDFRIEVELGMSRGEIAAVLGPSGCGKSTMLRLVAGLERPDSGRIVVGGRDVTALPPERRGIGMVFQDLALFPHMSVGANIAYGPRMRGDSRSARSLAVRSLAESLEIGELLNRRPNSLSGGERQRVALARSLAARPDLILLDEPLSSLDASLRRRLRSEIADRLRSVGMTAILVTHDPEEAFAMADRIFIMRDGGIEASGLPEALYESPPTAWSAAFLGRGPVLEILGLEGPASRPIAKTAIGDFACRPRGGAIPYAGESSLFFLASAPKLSTGSGESSQNRLRGIVVSSYFAGYCRRVSIACSSAACAPVALELELPAEQRPRTGETLCLEIDPGSCDILPGLSK